MNDNDKRAHDLAMLIVSELVSRDFESMKNSDSVGDEAREMLAMSVLEEYTFFFDAIKNSMK